MGKYLPLLILLPLMLVGCTDPGNELPLFQRSMIIGDQADVDRIMAAGSLVKIAGPEGSKVKLVLLSGTSYEMGYQHGALLREEIQELYNKVLKLLQIKISADMLDEVYDLMSPFIPLEEKEEMRGLAHGAGLSLRSVHWLHAIPGISEFSGKKTFSRGFLPTSCSNLLAFGQATSDRDLYQLRVLDWIRDLGVQQWPVILIHKPLQGHASATFSYAGFIGTVTGINSQGLAVGEKSYGNPEGESLEGIPFVFLLRQLLRESTSVDEAAELVRKATRTNAYIYLLGQAGNDNRPPDGMLLLTDRQQVEAVRENTSWRDKSENGHLFPAFDDLIYSGAKEEIITEVVERHYGRISPQVLMEMTRSLALNSNLQNVIFKPSTLEVWISNATTEEDEPGKASNQEWIYLNLAPYM